MNRHPAAPFLRVMTTLAILMIWGRPVSVAHAGTIELGTADITQAAAIHADAPMLSWGGRPTANGVFNAGTLPIVPRAAVLMQYNLTRIPPDMKITSARWTIPLAPGNSPSVKLHVWRTLADWGAGVCHRYARTLPEPVAWTTAGAAAAGVDRTIRPSAVAEIDPRRQELVIDVTRDVQMWHSGIQPNRGWLLGVDQDQTVVSLASPMHHGRDQWVLRITFEPE